MVATRNRGCCEPGFALAPLPPCTHNPAMKPDISVTFTGLKFTNPFLLSPAHPASKARMMFDSDSVGGADESRNGLVNFRPVNVTEMSGFMAGLWVQGGKGARVLGVRRVMALAPIRGFRCRSDGTSRFRRITCGRLE